MIPAQVHCNIRCSASSTATLQNREGLKKVRILEGRQLLALWATIRITKFSANLSLLFIQHGQLLLDPSRVVPALDPKRFLGALVLEIWGFGIPLFKKKSRRRCKSFNFSTPTDSSYRISEQGLLQKQLSDSFHGWRGIMSAYENNLTKNQHIWKWPTATLYGNQAKASASGYGFWPSLVDCPTTESGRRSILAISFL